MQNVGIEISIGVGFGFGKGFEKKVSDSVSKIFGIEKISVLVSEKNGIEKSFGFGIKNFWFRKKVLDSVLVRFSVTHWHTVSATIHLLKLLVLYHIVAQPTVEKRATVVHNATSLSVKHQL